MNKEIINQFVSKWTSRAWHVCFCVFLLISKMMWKMNNSIGDQENLAMMAFLFLRILCDFFLDNKTRNEKKSLCVQVDLVGLQVGVWCSCVIFFYEIKMNRNWINQFVCKWTSRGRCVLCICHGPRDRNQDPSLRTSIQWWWGRWLQRWRLQWLWLWWRIVIKWWWQLWW